jgi:predicted DNA-binding ribbon-helix-helix protein
LRRTSLNIEPAVWNALLDICRRERLTIHELCTVIVEAGPNANSLSSALRIFALNYYRSAATEQGHAHAGHGRHPRPPKELLDFICSIFVLNSVTPELEIQTLRLRHPGASGKRAHKPHKP